MASVVIENPETGETKMLEKNTLGKYPSFKLPWRVKGTLTEIQRGDGVKERIATIQSVLAVYASKVGLPVADFLDAARWMLDKECPFCQTVTNVLRRVAELGDERSMDLILRIKLAKDKKDEPALWLIKEEIRRALDGQG